MTLFYYNILLSHEYPIGRMKGPTRKKGDWFHSISVFSSVDINSIKDIIDGETREFLDKVIPRDSISKKSLYMFFNKYSVIITTFQ